MTSHVYTLPVCTVSYITFLHAEAYCTSHSGEHYPKLPDPRPVILRKKMTWDDLLAYLRTFSSLHTYHEKYPEDLSRPDGDIAVRFLNSLKADIAQHENKSAASIGDEVDIEWPLAVVLARRK